MNPRAVPPVVSALLWGSFSAASFPAGALVGLLVSVSSTMTGLLIAFGAGALIFAVTVEVRARAEAVDADARSSPQPAPCALYTRESPLRVLPPLVLVLQDAHASGRGQWERSTLRM